jgi:putative methyltransferase (TIGR04325 family)
MIGRITKKIRSLFGAAERRSTDGWSGNYKTWEEALAKTTGYDEGSILNKIKESVLKVKNGLAEYERDSVAFDTFEYSEAFLNALRKTVKQNSLSLIDFGGSLGSQYFQYKRFFEGLDINWMVVEQKHFVECGNREIANDQLRFFNSIEEALQYKKANTIVLSSVLPYLKEPFKQIEKIKSYEPDFIIIDRNPFIEMENDLLTVQVVPESIYKASYPAWFFNEEKFKKAFSDKYKIENEFSSPFSAPAIVNGRQAVWKGLILIKK